MKSSARMLMIALLALAIPAFAQRGAHGGGGGMGAGGGMGSGAGMGSEHGMSGSHDMGGASNAGSHNSTGMANESPDKVLSHNTAIAGKIKTLTGQDATTACKGFKNLGQCVAAAHVSKNLDIPFSSLQSKMTGSGAVSLGKAIQELKPAANSKSESKKANKQAEQDINESSS